MKQTFNFIIFVLFNLTVWGNSKQNIDSTVLNIFGSYNAYSFNRTTIVTLKSDSTFIVFDHTSNCTGTSFIREYKGRYKYESPWVQLYPEKWKSEIKNEDNFGTIFLPDTIENGIYKEAKLKLCLSYLFVQKDCRNILIPDCHVFPDSTERTSFFYNQFINSNNAGKSIDDFSERLFFKQDSIKNTSECVDRITEEIARYLYKKNQKVKIDSTMINMVVVNNKYKYNQNSVYLDKGYSDGLFNGQDLYHKSQVYTIDKIEANYSIINLGEEDVISVKKLNTIKKKKCRHQ